MSIAFQAVKHTAEQLLAAHPATELDGRLLCELKSPQDADPSELLTKRFLSRRGGLLLVGPTGVGKSSFVMQCMLLWALGNPSFGIFPSRPLTSLLIQAENDEGDLAEMRDGVISGIGLAEEDAREAMGRITVYHEDQNSGAQFFDNVVGPLLKKHTPDLLVIDPALSYLGGDSNSQEHVGRFLRNHLNPLLREFNCGCLLVHHTNKRSPEKDSLGANTSYVSYAGGGSAEWANWARAIITLQYAGEAGKFDLMLAKRGARVGWEDEEGNMTTIKLIGHSRKPGEIFWGELSEDMRPVKASSRKTIYGCEELLDILRDRELSFSEWLDEAKKRGWSKSTFSRRKADLCGADLIELNRAGTYRRSAKAVSESHMSQ